MENDIILSHLNNIIREVNLIRNEVQVNVNDQQKIMDLVCESLNVTISDLKSKRRQRKINIIPRQFYFLYSKALTDISYERLGVYIGWMDHTTIGHNINDIVNCLLVNNSEITYLHAELLNVFHSYGYDIDKIKSFIQKKKELLNGR